MEPAPRSRGARRSVMVFGIGLPELVIIVLVALVLINPKDLPALARRLGALVRKLRDLRDGFARAIRDAEREITGGITGGAEQKPTIGSKPRLRPAGDQSAPPGDSRPPYTEGGTASPSPSRSDRR